MTMFSWQLVGPQDGREWKAALLLLLGGGLGWFLSPLLWFAWGPMRWPAFLLASAAQESGFDPDIEGAAGEVGILQYSAASSWVALIALPPEVGVNDWRRSPFWSGYYAARYYNAQAWSAPGLILVWLIPVLGPAAARYTWTHELAVHGIDGTLRNALNTVYDSSTETSGERAFRVAYPFWWSVWHVPASAVAIALLWDRR